METQKKQAQNILGMHCGDELSDSDAKTQLILAHGELQSATLNQGFLAHESADFGNQLTAFIRK